ncbi:hypothetical protein HG535_0C03590 [Zygotorulaspora mrakii]|uniref:Transcription factor n=1 Tax=Zygotorulaspora mrakii TaxID=42260 RepID=A0A7H9B0I6_ZYGMR|nr:uncharacterized protein HG535_0C03590 [Zygotorulaspora mrakii]QLG72006.1 hypothetical protein HG535_0C03590 [Zygotorulaspora mrakii]
MKTQAADEESKAVLVTNKIKVKSKSEEDGAKECEESLRLIEDLNFFLATAPVNWQENQIIRRYYLNSDQGFVSCVFWNSLYYITGTDIVKCCIYRMQKFGREIIQKKKFEEGIFSDLRNLKCDIDATLEQPKSEFLSFLFRNMCLKTQKKQKVFFWFSVPHDKLFADALERDLKRENMDQPSTTRSVSEPALSFKYDSMSEYTVYEQLMKHVEVKRATTSPVSMATSRISDPSVNNVLEEENLHSSPLHLGTDVAVNGVPISSQMRSTAGTDILSGQSIVSSPDTSSNYTPQKLVVVEPSSLDLHSSIPENKISKDNVIVVDDSDHGDFPLDYFPVEIDHVNAEEDLESFNMPPNGAFAQPSMFYDNSFGSYDDEVVPATANFARHSHYSVRTPFPHPVSGNTSHFMTNGKYYSSQMKDKLESPNPNKEFLYMRYSDNEDSNEEQQPEDQDYSEQQQQQSHVPHYMNPYQKFYNPSMYPGYFLPGTMFGGPSDMVGQNNEIMNNGYDEMFPLQDSGEQGFYLPYESHNWTCVPPQAMQPPTATSAFVPKPYTPSYRTAPMSTINPYMSMAQSGWQQPLTSPYTSKATSATSKAYPNSAFYQSQPGPNVSHRRPYQSGPSASKSFASNSNKTPKSYHRKISPQKHQSKFTGTLKNKKTSYREFKDKEPRRQKFSIPTPESNNLNSQNFSNDYEKEENSDYTTSGFRKSLDESSYSD